MSLRLFLLLLVASALGTSVSLFAQDTMAPPPPIPVVDQQGTVHVPGFSVPLSQYMSAQAKSRFIHGLNHPPVPETLDRNNISVRRRAVDEWLLPKVTQAREYYPVDIEEAVIGGVPVSVVTPISGVSANNKARVLINLHGGGFVLGAGLFGLAESIPIAGAGRVKVVSVNYRMAPEHRFPAASEDVASVYKELLRSYQARNIGIYGCSAGGTLAAMAIAWFHKQGLPNPGAIGILSAAAFGNFYMPSGPASWGGDSAYVSQPLIGQRPITLHEDSKLPAESYLRDANLLDPLVSPGLWPDLLAHFPPTLLATGTRAFDMSAAIQTHRELVKAGVTADLHLWDGMGHCFIVENDLPESREAYNVIIKFFDEHLAK